MRHRRSTIGALLSQPSAAQTPVAVRGLHRRAGRGWGRAADQSPRLLFRQINKVANSFRCTLSSQHVSHETIYNAIYAYPRGELKKQLIALLRQGRGGRRPRSAGQDRRGQIPEMVSIHVRPPEVNDRLMPGH
jgi:hypothetical protein